jgi:beta-catenin-like protein 1
LTYSRSRTYLERNANLRACKTQVCRTSSFWIGIDVIVEKTYKIARLYKDSDTKSDEKFIDNNGEDEDTGDTDNIASGPELPPDFEAGDADGVENDEEGRFFGGGITAETAGALDFIDQRDEIDPLVRPRSVYADQLTLIPGHQISESIDSAWLRKRALHFEKKISKNAELRAKYEDTPEKYVQACCHILPP